ncbi:MAG: urate hydroxylase PuuD, partial [Bdellovibrionales bacterium]|nr:urate hydroxylase PuuD [Ramlibacter sp.]
KQVIASIKAGQPVDPVHGQRGKQCSVHNTYFTLPVLFAMLSNHYSFTWGHPQNWLVLILMMFAGAAIRQFFVMRHGYKLGRNRNPFGYALAGVAVLIGLIVWMKPLDTGSAAAPGRPLGYADIQPVLEQRCYMCHGAQVQMKNVRLDSAGDVKQHAQAIYQQVVVAKAMPMNNATAITEAERTMIGQWFKAGAKTP